MESEKRKLIKFSNYSLCVTLPKWVIKELNWKKGDSVNMQVDSSNGQITISKGKSKAKPKDSNKTEPDNETGLRW